MPLAYFTSPADRAVNVSVNICKLFLNVYKDKSLFLLIDIACVNNFFHVFQKKKKINNEYFLT